MQKKIFLRSEGDAWYKRNQEAYKTHEKDQDSIYDFICQHNLKPNNILEIGCSDGRRLDILNRNFKAKCKGIDVSSEAIKSGSSLYSEVDLSVGSADQLNFQDDEFDLVIFGFCLYLCDRKDLFKIACEADRVLNNGGYIIIKDFYPTHPYRNKYSHLDGLYSYKMNYADMFTWNPEYNLLSSKTTAHSTNENIQHPDERINLSLLYKSTSTAYPDKPSYSY